MNTRERYTQRIDSQQTRAFARDCSVRHAKRRPAKIYSIRLSECDAARLRRPPPRSDALSSGQRLSIEPNPSARIGICFTSDYRDWRQEPHNDAISPRIQTTRMIITGYITQTPEPNHALEPTTTAVTDRAPSSTLRASCGRGSS